MAIKVRSIFDLKDFKDNEVNSGEVLTDDSGYVPTEVLVARLLRGESITARYSPEYDINGLTEEEAWDTEDITKSPNFDLSDADDERVRVITKKKRASVISKDSQTSQKKGTTDEKKGTTDEPEKKDLPK